MSKTVLVVDDDKLSRQALADTLRACGVTVEEAENGRQGLSQTKASQPSLIVTDIHMPELGGLEMIQQLRKEEWGKNVPVIILTVDEAPTMINQALSAGVTVYLSKSNADPKAIADQVVNALGSA